MSRQNVFAYTETSGQYPGYLSVNKENSGEIAVTVRESSSDGNKSATLILPREELAKFVKAAEEFLYPEGGQRQD